MSTIRTDNLSNSAGTSTVTMNTVVNGTAKAWVNFNGTGTVAIRSSFNVSSITDIGTGQYRVNFTTAMADVNYAMSGFANSFSDGTGDLAGLVTGYSTLNAPTTAGFTFATTNSFNGDVFDASRIAIVFFD